ncbi:MAG: LCP family protein [Erysipelotrichaceae bacterium]|nr:LCP family protein [Erysipelotrichaceae bacterium]
MKRNENTNRNKGKKAFSIITLIMTVLAHAGIIALVIVSYQYFGLELGTALGLVGLVLCLLIIVDILFLVGYRFKDHKIKIVNFILALLLFISSAFGFYYVSKINSNMNNIIDNSGTDQYETIGGVFTYYKNNSTDNYHDLEDLKSVSNLKVGVLYDDGIGTGTLASSIMEENDIKANISTYNSTDELLSALVGEDNGVDIAVFPASYRQRLSSDENVDYSQFLDNMIDFYSFEEKVKTGENEKANIDLSSEPFNILLIGFAPENEAMTYGLADSIIVATINPQTFTVSMTSIARDSFVPITCNGGNRDKINAARGTSRQCLMDTVGQLLDMEINYYMEVNFLGVVQIVDAIGGIRVNNPVTFIGQTASGIRGTYTVGVPAGENVLLNGEQALAFARERHAMPNGDFDRQQHQQEVIAKIAEGLIELRDVNKALDVMKAAGDNMSTNLSLSQLTGIFNYLVNSKNYTGLPTFKTIDIRNVRITGYASWTYNYPMRLPLWIYKLYKGSIQEAKDNIADVLNKYNYSEIEQLGYMKFFAQYPYYRGSYYSAHFDEPEEHESMPAYYPYLTKYTFQEALAWANKNGVRLIVTVINPGDKGYDASLDGMVVDQSPRHGALVSEYPVGYVTVMGDPDYVPEYIVEGCNDAASCKAFAEEYGIEFVYADVYTSDPNKDGMFYGTNFENGDTIKKDQKLIIYIYKYVECGANSSLNSETGACVCNSGYQYDSETGGCSLIPEPTCGANAHNEGGSCVCDGGYEGDPYSGCTLIDQGGGESGSGDGN